MTDPTPLMQSDLENGRVVIRVSGEIDLSNAERLETQIDEATAGVPSVVIDLTAVDFIDSRGLRLLKRIATAVAERSGTFVVVAPPDSIARSVLDLTRMTDELGVRDSLPTAVD